MTYKVGCYYTLEQIEPVKASLKYLSAKEITFNKTIYLLRQGDTNVFWVAGPLVKDQSSNVFMFLGPQKAKSQMLVLVKDLLKDYSESLKDYSDSRWYSDDGGASLVAGLIDVLTSDELAGLPGWFD